MDGGTMGCKESTWQDWATNTFTYHIFIIFHPHLIHTPSTSLVLSDQHPLGQQGCTFSGFGHPVSGPPLSFEGLKGGVESSPTPSWPQTAPWRGLHGPCLETNTDSRTMGQVKWLRQIIWCVFGSFLIIIFILNMGDLGSVPGLGRSPGEGKGYSCQYSGLENSTESVVHGVTRSWTWLSDFHFQCLPCSSVVKNPPANAGD